MLSKINLRQCARMLFATKVHQLKLVTFPIRCFPRNIPKSKSQTQSVFDSRAQKEEKDFMSSMDEKEDVKDYLDSALYQSTPMIHDETENFEKKPRSQEEIDLDLKCRYNIDLEEIPEDILKRVNKVFSKHSRFEVRKWAEKLIEHYNIEQEYQIMVAQERPLNLDYAKPFSNTNDLVKNVPEISFSTAAEKQKKEKELEEFIKNAQTSKEINIDKQNTENMSYSEKESYEEKQVVNIKYEREQVVGFLQRKYIQNYFVYKRVLSEIAERDPKFKPETFLDFGAGLGSASWAGIHLFKNSLKRIAAVEPNVNMRQIGKFLSKELEPEILWIDSLSMIPGAGSDRGLFDVVIMGFVLPEIPSAKGREVILEAVFSKVKKNGYFILIEYGTPKGYRFINDFRNMIIEMPREEVNIVAPCPHHHKCPLASMTNSWCHFSQLVRKWPKDVFPKHPREKQHNNEKFSYLVVKKGLTPAIRRLYPIPRKGIIFTNLKFMKSIPLFKFE